jgi:hypothetical protein
VAATLASLSIPFNLSAPEIVKPHSHPLLHGQKIPLSAEEATTRIKGLSLEPCQDVSPPGDRLLISRNKYARRIFSVMDDIFYGRNPKPGVGPQWARFKSWKLN